VPQDEDRPQSQDDVKALVQDRGIRFIRLWFTDILGQLQSFSINAEELDDASEGGMGFDGSSIRSEERPSGTECDSEYRTMCVE
jgi:glutamine synthetase